MRPLRIAHVVAALIPGGAERQALMLAERLPRDRFQVDFLSLVGAGDYDDRARAAGLKVVHLAHRPAEDEGFVEAMVRRSQMGYRLARAMRRGRYDIVDAWLYPADVLTVLVREATGNRAVMSGRRNIHPHDRFGRLGVVVDRYVAARIDAVVANSDSAAANAIRAHGTDPGKLRIIRNGVEPIEPLDDATWRWWRQRMGATDDEIVIGCVGNYRDMKRHDLLIDAFARLAKDDPRLRLVLVGEGDMRPAMERQVAQLALGDRIRLHGTEQDPRPMYRAFDLVVQASRSEGLPNVLLEAASASRAIVATDAGGSPEVVKDGVTGLLVPIENLEALTNAMRVALADADLRARLGAAAAVHVDEAFGVGRYVREWASLYEEIAAAKGIVA